MFDAICPADQIKPYLAERHAVTVSRLPCELDAIVHCPAGYFRRKCPERGENGVDLVWHRLKQMLQKLPGRFAVGFLNQLRNRELAGSVNGNKEIWLAFLRSHLSNIDMEIADGVALELLALWLVTFDAGQTGYPVPLQTTMQ